MMGCLLGLRGLLSDWVLLLPLGFGLLGKVCGHWGFLVNGINCSDWQPSLEVSGWFDRIGWHSKSFLAFEVGGNVKNRLLREKAA